MNVVCIGAHQDDVELHCLGTLLKYQQRGDVQITIVATTNGNKGSQHDPKMPYAQVAAIRAAEATALAEALGGRYIGLEQEDQYLRDTDELRNRLTDILRAAKADLVIAPPPVDYSSDHMVTSRLAFEACALAGYRSIFTEHEPLSSYPALFYMDSLTGLESQPTHYVDISEVFARKCELLRLYKSQMKNMERSGWDLVKYAQIVGAFRGLQCGVEYAEGFRPALAFPRMRPGSLLP
jgi:LmbE family N-acetylglucosaminyl deacetylase